MKMRIGDICFTLLFGVFAISMLFVANGFVAGSKVFPLGVLSFMLFLLGVVLVKQVWQARTEKTSPPSNGSDDSPDQSFFINPRLFGLVSLIAVLYVASMDFLGFFTSGAILFLSLVFITGYREWRLTVSTMVIFLAGIYFVFVWLFERPLPPELIIRLIKG